MADAAAEITQALLRLFHAAGESRCEATGRRKQAPTDETVVALAAGHC
jgi:hypothetical protein